MLFINCNFFPELNWDNDCIMSSVDKDTKFNITDTKTFVPIVTLSTKD